MAYEKLERRQVAVEQRAAFLGREGRQAVADQRSDQPRPVVR